MREHGKRRMEIVKKTLIIVPTVRIGSTPLRPFLCPQVYTVNNILKKLSLGADWTWGGIGAWASSTV